MVVRNQNAPSAPQPYLSLTSSSMEPPIARLAVPMDSIVTLPPMVVSYVTPIAIPVWEMPHIVSLAL